MKATITSKKILQEARKLIKAGWTQGTSHRMVGKNTHYCLSGAVYAAHKKLGTGYVEYASAESALRTAIGLGNSIIGYNDAESRRKTQVLAKLDKAIKNVSNA